MKRLVICCDGTWNTPTQTKGGEACPTNVFTMSEAVADVDSHGARQVTYYHEGVGAKLSERIRGGLFGFGLSRDVQSAYRFVVENFAAGDELFLFGFSRGAYTVRSTAGLIRNAGVLRAEHADRISEAYALYRDRKSAPRSAAAERFRQAYSVETKIRFIGVWDTVGALGIPLSGMRMVGLVNRRWQFHDTDLSSRVESAYQAVAIDERRSAFRPTLWNQQAQAEDQTLEQVWFSGVHSDVGGGYPDGQLADLTLAWLAGRAHAQGLAFDEVVDVDHEKAALGPLHNSLRGFYRLFGSYPRPIGQAPSGEESAASTAVERRNARSDYRVPTLESYLELPDARVTDVAG